jgi:hypothetical protein
MGGEVSKEGRQMRKKWGTDKHWTLFTKARSKAKSLVLLMLAGFVMSACGLAVPSTEGIQEIPTPTETPIQPATPTLTPTPGPAFPAGLAAPLGDDWPAITADTATNVERVYEHHVDGLVEVLGSVENEILALITHDWVTFINGDDLNPITSFAIDAFGDLTAAEMDAGLFVLASRDRYLRVFDVPRVEARHVLDGEVEHLALSSDGRVLAGAGVDGLLTLWDLETGERMQVTTLQVMPSRLTFLPDGDTLAVELAGEPLEHVELWSVEGGELTRTLEWADRSGPIYFVTFSPDGTTAAWVSRASVLLMEVASGDARATLGHEDFVSEAIFAPQGEILATTSAAEVDDEFVAVIDLWDVRSGEKLQTIVHGDAAVRIDFSPDGSLLASATYDGVIRLWDIVSGEMLQEFDSQQERVFRLFFAYGGRLLLCASWEGPVRIYAVQE